MKLIGLNGRKLSGKDEAFKILRDNNPGVNFLRTSFADKIKLSGMRALGYTYFEDEIDKAVAMADHIKENCTVAVIDARNHHIKQEISGREWWQFYGTESHRDIFGFDFWVDQVFPNPQGHTKEYVEYLMKYKFLDVDVVVETTVRFENEARRILDLGGEIWRIDADKRLGPLPPEAHVSEHGLPADLVTLTIPNNSSLEQFQHGVKTAWALSTGGVTRC